MPSTPSEWSVLVEALKSGGAFGGALVLIVTAMIGAIKFGIIPMLREAKPISENLKSTSESNERAAQSNVEASRAWAEAAKVSKEAAATWATVAESQRASVRN